MSTVSVVILTANRRPLLEKVLRHHERAERVPDEIVIVNNHSKDDTAEFLANTKFAFPVNVVDGPEGSFSEARNAGVAAANGDLIAFIDDDCEPDPAWLRRLVQAIERNGWDAAGGAVLPAKRLPSPDWYSPGLAWTIGCTTPTFFGPLGGRLEIPTTSNMIFRREAVPDPPFKTITEDKKSLTWNYEFSREDAELWRTLRRNGHPVGIVPRAIAWHHVPADRIDKERAIERARQDGRGFWNREPIHDELRPAVRDIVYMPAGIFGDLYSRGIPFEQSWTERVAWTQRQLAMLEYAVDDHNNGISPSKRLRHYTTEGAGFAVSIAKGAARNVFGLARDAFGAETYIPTPEDQPESILVVLHDLLGDTVLALPMLRQLARAMPYTRIHVLTGKTGEPLLQANRPRNVTVHRAPGGGAKSPAASWRLREFLRRLAPEAVLLAYTHGLNPLPFLTLPRAPVIAWGEDNGLRQRLYADMLTIRLPKAFHKAEAAALLDLLAPFGIETRIQRPRLRASDPARERRTRILTRAGIEEKAYALLHVESDGRDKIWPCDRFIALADHLHRKGLPVVMDGSPTGRAATERARATRPWLHSLHGLLNTDELAAMAEGARLYIGSDSGPAHVAQAVGTPSLILFGELHQHRWGPLPQLPGEDAPPPFRTIAAAPGDWLVEEKRGMPKNQSMLLLSVENVIAATDQLLAEI